MRQKDKAFRKWMRRRRVLHRAEYEEAKNVVERVKRKAKKDAWGKKLRKELDEKMEGKRKLINNIAKDYKR